MGNRWTLQVSRLSRCTWRKRIRKFSSRPYPAAICKNFGALPVFLHTPPGANWLRPWCFASLACAVCSTHSSVVADPRYSRASTPWTPSVRSPDYRSRSHGRRRGLLFLRLAVSVDVASSPDGVLYHQYDGHHQHDYAEQLAPAIAQPPSMSQP